MLAHHKFHSAVVDPPNERFLLCSDGERTKRFDTLLAKIDADFAAA
jgi:hypothetical protein